MANGDKQLTYPAGYKIKAIRKKHNLTQKDLADKIGIKRSQLAQWEAGIRNPLMNNVRRIADALDISPEEIINYDDAPEMTEEDFLSEAKSDPMGFRINTLYMLSHGINAIGLDELIKTADAMTKDDKYRRIK